jgi:hypothetical protein
MGLHSHNGNGGAVILPPPTRTIYGRSLAHRQLDKRERAILAADVIDGLARIVPTQAQVAAMFGVSVPYVQIARDLSPGKRAAILHGRDPTSFAKLARPSRQLTLPVVTEIPNSVLENLIRSAGIERVLDVAAAVERTS